MALNRRSLLIMTTGVSTAIGLGAATTAAAAAPAAPARTEELPDVPGMSGDRRANEFWYQFDQETGFEPSPRLLDAYQAIGAHVGGDIKNGLREQWLSLSKQPEYPRNYISFVAPLAEPLAVVSEAQLSVIDRFYPRFNSQIIAAFAYFGQGVLYDPRRADRGSEVHMMDELVAYHTWHAYQRAMMFLGINSHRWEQLAPVTAFTWAVQSVAMPQMREINPPLPRPLLNRLARNWLTRDLRELDAAYQSVPSPENLFPGE